VTYESNKSLLEEMEKSREKNFPKFTAFEKVFKNNVSRSFLIFLFFFFLSFFSGTLNNAGKEKNAGNNTSITTTIVTLKSCSAKMLFLYSDNFCNFNKSLELLTAKVNDKPKFAAFLEVGPFLPLPLPLFFFSLSYLVCFVSVATTPASSGWSFNSLLFFAF
jgi:hypothetical protein